MALNASKTEFNYSRRMLVNWIAARKIKKFSDFLQVSQGAYT